MRSFETSDEASLTASLRQVRPIVIYYAIDPGPKVKLVPTSCRDKTINDEGDCR
jgi:hypothetical protein